MTIISLSFVIYYILHPYKLLIANKNLHANKQLTCQNEYFFVYIFTCIIFGFEDI